MFSTFEDWNAIFDVETIIGFKMFQKCKWISWLPYRGSYRVWWSNELQSQEITWRQLQNSLVYGLIQVSVQSFRQGNCILYGKWKREWEYNCLPLWLWCIYANINIQEKMEDSNKKRERFSKLHAILMAPNLPETGRLPNLHDFGWQNAQK